MKPDLCAALLFLCSCLAVAQAPAAPASPQGGDSPQIKQAQQLNSEGKFEEALAVLDQVLAVSPQDYEANLTSGIVLDMQGDFGKARGYLRKPSMLPRPPARCRHCAPWRFRTHSSAICRRLTSMSSKPTTRR